MIQLYPGESKLRAARGEVEHEDRWMLPDTVSSKERREEIADDVANLRERLQHDLRVDGKLKKASWKGAFTCRGRTAVGTVEASEVRDAMLYMLIGDYIASDVLETNAPADKVLGPTTAILVPGTDAARAVARNLGCGKDIIVALDRVHSIYVDDGQTALFLSGWRPYRLLGPLSYTLAAHITQRFGHHKQGWLKEGLRQRLIYLVTGRHGKRLTKYRITATADGLVGRRCAGQSPCLACGSLDRAPRGRGATPHAGGPDRSLGRDDERRRVAGVRHVRLPDRGTQ